MKRLIMMFPGASERREEIETICRGRFEVVIPEQDAGEEEWKALLSGTEIVIGDPDPSVLLGAEDLKWLQISWAGVGPYVEAPHLRDVLLTNASGAYGKTIAEHTIGMLLTLARRFPQYLKQQEAGIWADAGAEWMLEGKTALILGAGDLGSELAKRLAAFEMKTIGLVRTPREAVPPFSRLIAQDELDETLSEADVVCGCLPGTPETAGLLSKERLARMKKDAILLNVGRGNLIDTDALVKELKEGRFFGVGLDVTDPEPLPADHPLRHCPNTIITPHVAGVGFDHHTQTDERIWQIALANLRRYINGEPLTNRVSRRQGY